MNCLSVTSRIAGALIARLLLPDCLTSMADRAS